PVYWLVYSLKIFKNPQVPDFVQTVKGLLLWPVPAPFINVSWTLSYEAFFYVLILIAIITPRGALSLFPAAVLLLLPIVPNFAQQYNISAFLQSDHLHEFLMGMGVAVALKRWGAPPVWISKIVLWCACISFVTAAALGTLWVADYQTMTNTTAYDSAALVSNGLFDHGSYWFGGPTALILFAMVALELRGRLRVPFGEMLRKLGNISYSLYLVHGFVISMFISVWLAKTSTRSSPLHLMAAWAVAIGTAAVFYKFIEIPSMRAGSRLARWWTSRPALS
ncbi:MAG: acyltransferase, partial [Rubrivivax sp.]